MSKLFTFLGKVGEDFNILHTTVLRYGKKKCYTKCSKKYYTNYANRLQTYCRPPPLQDSFSIIRVPFKLMVLLIFARVSFYTERTRNTVDHDS